jgi:hypothetical protein
MLTYFAADGNYGDATGLVIVDTSTWDEETWNHIEEVQESFRPYRAIEEQAVREG